jgi:hypothetical protein
MTDNFIMERDKGKKDLCHKPRRFSKTNGAMTKGHRNWMKGFPLANVGQCEHRKE